MTRTFSAWGSFFLVLTLFAVPMSSTVRDILVVLALISFGLDKNYRANVKRFLNRPWVFAALILFLLACAGCFWGPASWHAKWLVLKKFNKLLYIPFLAVGFQEARIRHAAIHAFLLAMLITCILLVIKSMGLIHYGGDDPGKLFHNHILTGYMLAFASYLTAWLASKTQGFKRVLYGTFCVLLSYTLIFICTGRMAYIAYLMGMLIWFFQYFSWRKALLWSTGFLFCFALSYLVNSTMQFLVHQAKDDVTSYHQANKNTSLGLRMQFHLYAYGLFKQHPWIGNGTGGFSALFKQDRPIPNWKQGVIWEPHSQYWLIAADYGLLGLGIYAFFLAGLLWEILKLLDMRAMALVLFSSFIVGSLTDSLMLYSGTGYFFFLFMALCFGSIKSSSKPCNLVDEADDQAHLWLSTKADEIQT
jgi:hypothetical protein